MNSYAEAFAENGYAVIPDVLLHDDIERISTHLETFSGHEARTRTLLNNRWCAELSRWLRSNHGINSLLPRDAVAIQATYFPKAENENWKVALHRDFFVPVKTRIDLPGWSGWSEKEGIPFVRPPDEFLEQLVAVRVHLEANTPLNGPLVVVPGSHTRAIQAPRVQCLVPAGGAVAMRPMLLHASSKVQTGTRRVLHFLFSSNNLPYPLEWANAV